jgi:hypothetical protein
MAETPPVESKESEERARLWMVEALRDHQRERLALLERRRRARECGWM